MIHFICACGRPFRDLTALLAHNEAAHGIRPGIITG
jgi:hypothetical protein